MYCVVNYFFWSFVDPPWSYTSMIISFLNLAWTYPIKFRLFKKNLKYGQIFEFWISRWLMIRGMKGKIEPKFVKIGQKIYKYKIQPEWASHESKSTAIEIPLVLNQWRMRLGLPLGQKIGRNTTPFFTSYIPFMMSWCGNDRRLRIAGQSRTL